MKKLIYLEDAIAAVSVSAFSINTVYGRSERGMKALQDAVMALKAVPSAEPEIIRCKDCANWDRTWTNDFAKDYHYCPMIDGVRKKDFYCADAERREEET